MTGRDFLNSKWVQMAARTGASRGIGGKFNRWLRKVRSASLLKRSRELWEYFHSPAVSKAEKAIILGALFYLISPFDVVPDFIPMAGLLDDLGVATFVINYITRKLDENATIEGMPGEEMRG